jgi:hypothetical protein
MRKKIKEEQNKDKRKKRRCRNNNNNNNNKVTNYRKRMSCRDKSCFLNFIPESLNDQTKHITTT